jgi:hypothetical protein
MDGKDPVKLGVIEFHSERTNSGLTERFYAVVDDLRKSGSIVDVWLMDIAAVLREFGYDMRVYRMPKQKTPADDEGPCPDGQHRWVGKRMGGPPDMAESCEWVEYCDVCGVENTGD